MGAARLAGWLVSLSVAVNGAGMFKFTSVAFAMSFAAVLPVVSLSAARADDAAAVVLLVPLTVHASPPLDSDRAVVAAPPAAPAVSSSSPQPANDVQGSEVVLSDALTVTAPSPEPDATVPDVELVPADSVPVEAPADSGPTPLFVLQDAGDSPLLSSEAGAADVPVTAGQEELVPGPQRVTVVAVDRIDGGSYTRVIVS